MRVAYNDDLQLQVNITGLFSCENNQNLSYGKFIKAVAIDPEVKSGVRRFIVGKIKTIKIFSPYC